MFNFLYEMPERDAKYRYRAIAVISPIAFVTFGLVGCCAVWLPWWASLPLSVVIITLGLLGTLWSVNRIMPKKFPTGEDW
jgi:hypothetical protein